MVQTFLEARVTPFGPRLLESAPPLSVGNVSRAWPAAISRLREDPEFGDTAFLRIEAITESESSLAFALRTACPSDNYADGLVLATDPNGTTVAAEELAEFVQINLASGLASVRIEVQHPRFSGQLDIRMADATAGLPTGAVNGVVGSAVRSPDRPTLSQGGVELFEYVLEIASQVDPLQRAQLAGRIATLSPGNRRLQVHQAKALLDGRAPAAAADVLRDIPEAERTAEIHALMVDAILGTGDVDSLEPHLARATFDEWAFDQLVRALEGLPSSIRDVVVTRLCSVLSAERMAELVARIGSQLSPGPQLGTVARRVAEASPSDALALLERVGSPDQMPTPLLSMIVDLRLVLDPTQVGESALALAQRLVRSGELDLADALAQAVSNALDWRESERLAELLVDGLQRLGQSEWTDDHELYAYTALDHARSAVRGARDVDLIDAFDISTRLRQALSPIAPAVTTAFDELDDELLAAWQASEAHRQALAELTDAKIESLRQVFASKRLLVVGGRIADWWTDMREELALERGTEWAEVEPGRRPSMDWLKSKVTGGKLAVLVVMVEYIGHSTSAISDFAKERGIPSVESRNGRASFVRALERVAPQVK